MRLLALALLVLTLAACEAVTPAPVDPTAAAVAYQETAIALQDTRSASDLRATQAQATAEVIRLQSTAAYLVQYSQAMSTATAVIDNREIARANTAAAARRARSWRALGLFMAWGLGLLLLAFCVMMIHVLWLRGLTQAANMRAAYMPAPTPPAAQLPEYTQLAGGDVGTDETIQFLATAARVIGRDSARLPRYDAMGWSADRWTIVTNRLAAAGVLTKVSGGHGGSFIRMPWRDIAGVHKALSTGALRLPPSPAGGVSRNQAPNVRANIEHTSSGGGW